MANFRNTNDLKKLVLQHCGELTDGSSPYDSIALAYLNTLQHGLTAGGNEFGIDVSEAWPWAMAKYPITMKLKTEYSTGTITMIQDSFSGVFSSAPSVSVEGYYLKAESVDDYFIIRQHTAGSTSFKIDQLWITDSDDYNFTAFPLEYDISDDTIIVDSSNNKLDMTINSGTVVATLTAGIYTPANFATHVIAQMTTAGVNTPTCVYNSITRMFTIGQGGPTLTLLASSGSNINASGWSLLGFDPVDKSGSTSYTSDNTLNPIQRLVAPIGMYRSGSSLHLAPEDTGKIYLFSYNTLLKKYPMNQMNLSVPEAAAVVRHNANGTLRVRFNSYPTEEMRIEIPYIPVALDLQDNTASVPTVPRSFREYLVYGACYYLMMDKSDNRAETFANLAVQKLKAMVNDSRAHKEMGSNTFGKLIPRSIKSKLFWSSN